ncbi:CxC2 domain-containing protein [Mycena sanguinolenta]|uniref:CxC2 domain-containing protein n=1 Tax=Mycena sanguinolenta TaxID=230812 RepID=A0A8H6X882_9AGAR|nr:CxC2 domain-containing protein [Mycena sanguinolenta]
MNIYRCEPPFYPDPGEPAAPPPHKRVYLVCGGNVENPGGYLSWVSADSAYKGVPGATLKRFNTWEMLRRAWHARCDAGDHPHPAHPMRNTAAESVSPPPSPLPRPIRTHRAEPHTPPVSESPPLRTYIIESRSPSPVPRARPLHMLRIGPGFHVPRTHHLTRLSRPPPPTVPTPLLRRCATLCALAGRGRFSAARLKRAPGSTRYKGPGWLLVLLSHDLWTTASDGCRILRRRPKVADARVIHYAEDDDEEPEDSDSVESNGTTLEIGVEGLFSSPRGPAAIKIKKAKRYENSDHPLKSWIPHRDDILDGLMRLEGRGMWWRRLLCASCILERHRDEPLHLLQEWEDGFFQPRTTRDLGLRYQIGHPPGEDCPWTRLTYSGEKFVVLHNNGIHIIDIDFCGCSGAPSEVNQLLNVGWYPATSKEPSTAATLSLLRRFHKLNLQARVPGYDFYNSLVLLTNANGLKKLPNRLPQFMNMVREYRHLQMCKRAGRGHHARWYFGHDAGWIYRLMVSMDANFKMKGRDRSSKEKDPTLGPGWAYMVANDEYLKHLVKYIDEDEISHCVSFAALWSANNKRAKGLRASGIASVSCSRHEMFRPRGTGDLQKGENLIGVILLMLLASYDIACQWSRNIWTRAKSMPAHMKLSTIVDVIFKVPKFHLPPHVKACHAPYSFNYTKGVGRTDGEGIERNWSWLNGAARSISVMVPGAREDTIDDICAFSNWKKTVDLGNSLLRKMRGCVRVMREDLLKWERMVRAWEADNTKENPYDYVDVEAETMADVMKRISEEDHARVVASGAAALEVNPAAFLLAGIEIQETQRVLQAVSLEAKRRSLTTIQATSLQRQRTLLLGKIAKLHDVQGQYMPGLTQWMARQLPPLPARDSSKPETIKIYLPSSLPTADREAVCAPGLVAQEERLCKAQAEDSLRDLRRGLRTRTFAHRFKRQHLSGQGEWERILQELRKEDIRGMNERMMNEEEKEENRKARLLAGLSADAQGDELDDFGEPVELTVLFNLETGEGKRQLSWIWYTAAQAGADQRADGSLHPDIRVEWMKARARADRWREELILVEEEMRRVLEFCVWKTEWWQQRLEPQRGPERSEITPELAEGLRAYALEQVFREQAWLAAWKAKWETVRVRTATVLRDHLVDVTEEVLVPLEVELDDEDEERAIFEDDGFEEEEDA